MINNVARVAIDDVPFKFGAHIGRGEKRSEKQSTEEEIGEDERRAREERKCQEGGPRERRERKTIEEITGMIGTARHVHTN